MDACTPAEFMWPKVIQIYQGTNQIQRGGMATLLLR